MNAANPFSHTVMVFSKNYMPLNQVNVKRAIILLISGRAEPLPLDKKDREIAIQSPSIVFKVPRYIRLTVSYTQRAWKIPAVNRREVLRRDKHTCQYCGSTKRLTLDHIIPRSKGGEHSWTNVVTACERCNSSKGDRTPQQAGMFLRCNPKPPVHPLVAFSEQFWREHGQEFTQSFEKISK